MEESENQGLVPAINRAVNVLDYLAVHKSATVKELSSVLHIPSASAGRIIKTLVFHNYLREEQGIANQYSLGLKLLSFSQIVSQQLDVGTIAHEYMHQLSEQTNQASQLAIFDNGNVMYTELVLPRTPVSIVAPLRTPIAINLSAGGKVLLAGMPPEQQSRIIDSIVLIKATENSITDKQVFSEHLQQVRLQGYALDAEEFSIGIGCIAAPVFNYEHQVVAAVGVTGPMVAYTDAASFERIKTAVLTAAQEISEKIGSTLT